MFTELDLSSINRVLLTHKAKELNHKSITKYEFSIIQQLCWIKWEYNNYKRIKQSDERNYVLNKLSYTASYLCERYFLYV